MQSFQRTYEELKRDHLLQTLPDESGFQRTYEELKQAEWASISQELDSFQRTYEELKLRKRLFTAVRVC